MDTDQFLKILQNRSSAAPKYLGDPPPNEEQLLEAVKCGLAAPDHKSLRPCRIVLIKNRAKMADFFEAGALNAGADQKEAERARTKALKGAGLLAFVVKIDINNEEVPAYEQWLACGAFLMNVVTALELQGFGLKVVTGSNVRWPEVTKPLCRPGETLACWIIVGTLTDARLKPKEPVDASHYLSVFE
ncbi:MAG: nitroreductase family protein [Burkholderiales bacterium]|nr:nitroreductase family protein [Burkholderiales bacterium]